MTRDELIHPAPHGPGHPTSGRRVARAAEPAGVLVRAVLMAVLVVGLLAGCTATAGKPEAAAAAATSPGAGPAPSHRRREFGWSGIRPEPPPPQRVPVGLPSTAGRLRAPARILARRTSADTTAAIPPVSYAADPAQTAIEKVLPGMYGLSSLGAAVKGAAVTIDAAANCAFVLEVIGSGQWAVTALVKPAKGENTYLAALTDGSRKAALILTDNGNQCQGTITPGVAATFSVSGALTDSGAAQLFPMSCVPEGTDPEPVYAIYLTQHASYLVAFAVPPTAGAHTATGPDNAEVLFYQSSAGGPDLAAGLSALKAATSSSAAGSEDGILPGWAAARAFVTAEGTTVSTTVTATKPLAGTLTITKAANPKNPSSTITVKAGFGCSS